MSAVTSVLACLAFSGYARQIETEPSHRNSQESIAQLLLASSPSTALPRSTLRLPQQRHASNHVAMQTLSGIERLGLLSKLAESGLLENLEKKGFFTWIEKNGLLSKTEELLPVLEEKGLLTTLESALAEDAGEYYLKAFGLVAAPAAYALLDALDVVPEAPTVVAVLVALLSLVGATALGALGFVADLAKA